MRNKHIIQTTHTKLAVRRWMAFLLCAALVGGMVNTALPALAAGDADSEVSEDAYCEHHTEHTEECGYVEAVEGQPCNHDHDEDCGYAKTVECGHVHDDSCGYVEADEEQSCTHEHDGECGYTEAVECTYEHDEECGYVEAVEGQPCRFVCDICGDGSEEAAEESEETEEDSEQITAVPEVKSMAAVNEKGLVAYFNFDNPDNRLQDSLGKGVEASLYKVNTGAIKGSPIESGSEDWDNCFDGEGDNANALHLNNDDYLEFPADTLSDLTGLTDMTVEMNIKLDSSQQGWLFYASPVAENGADNDQSLGINLTDKEEIQATRNSDDQPGYVQTSYSDYDDGQWHTVSAVYKADSTALYVDGVRVAENGTPNKLEDYLEDDMDIWFGHSAWTDHDNFTGYIDDIKIYDYDVYADPIPIDESTDGIIDEQKYIITQGVHDPANTTVHMFDYWITGQTDNDYRPSSLTGENLKDNGINKGHLFLFAGSDSVQEGDDYPTKDVNVGAWNNYQTQTKKQYEPYRGIVGKTLDSDGYPHLAINQLNVTVPVALGSRSKTESLGYLFDLSEDEESKAVYRNVTGLFRLDNKGYYYFRSPETFAELNINQTTGAKKTDPAGNKITLYDRPLLIDNNGQFFPFNDWSDMFFELDGKGGMVREEAAGMNHYLGMTVETKFHQPKDGIITHKTGDESMEFEFSGDDDVWIFIDGVLVGDLGGLHRRVHIKIDFSTGLIDYTGALDSEGYPTDTSEKLEDFDTTLYEAFDDAGMAGAVEWKTVNGNKLFADDSAHTLKFFYLERGNAASNCSIKFNFYQPEEVSTNQSSEWDEFVDEPAEQPEVKEEAKTDGVLASPHTGDSKMVVVWITLLVCSITGIVVLYRTRKRESKQ